ncbi:MAG: ATP-binding protein [Candidatus Omnitrophica bacterium]|nr:ATP-binding protein [Candidatus Omnitrophota bacterium]MDD5352848.1 ATP-binding protein [Candidatus Omnitrophota bacterium]MDD5550447.1 ATP-binding protein [Candidatus Omnitrophota bacterium]
MIIVFTLIGFVFVYAIAIVYQRKKSLLKKFPRDPFHKFPPQVPSYLEDKMWYEAELDFLFKFNEKLVSAFSLQGVAQCITEAANNFLPIERTVFLAWNKSTEKFTLACAIGWYYDRNKGPLIIGKDSISGLVMRNREKLVVSDLAQDYYLSKLKKEEYFLQKAFISVPLIYKDEVLGVLHICDKKTPGTFTQREVSVAMNIGRMGAIALQNARLYEEVSKRAVELKIAYDELKEMQDKLIQSEKLKAIGQLASSVAHEMRNPLGTIMQGVAYLEQIISPEAKEPHEALSIVKENAQRADKIVISLLDFSRATKLELHPEYIDPIIENSLNLIKTELKNIKVVKEIQKDLPKVLVDKNKLTQVFINLFMNAIHAMPESGKLTIRSFVKQLEETRKGIDGRPDDSFKAGENVVVIEIEDTGMGISEENLKRIFDPFFTTKEPGKGTGLGLSVSRNIIIMHKGLIEVKSQVKKGTKVIITLKIPE